MRSARQFGALAQHTLVQLLRAPMVCLVLVTALLLAGILPRLDYLSFLEKRRLVADSLLALTLCSGVAVAALGAGLALTDAVRGRAAMLVLSKPVSRSTYLLGKFAGLAAALAIVWLPLGIAVLWGSRVAIHDYWPDTLAANAYLLILLAGLLLAVVLNHWRRVSLPCAATLTLAVLLPLGFLALGFSGYRGGPGAGWPLVEWGQLPAILLLYPALLLAAAVALAAATRLSGAGSLAVTLVVFLFGLSAITLASRPEAGGLRWAALFWPDWQTLWIAERSGAAAAWQAAGQAAVSGLLQTAAVLWLALGLFESRELG